MDNQALAVLIAVALFGAVAIGIVSHTETQTQEAAYTPRFTYVSENYSTN